MTRQGGDPSAGGELRWRVRLEDGEPRELHSSAPISGRTVRLCHPTVPGVVIGSSQAESDVDMRRAEASGLQVVRRRSGGGAVLVVPGDIVWVEVAVGRDDPLWDDDVGRASWWLGETWASTLQSLGTGPATAHRGPMKRTAWSAKLCFAGLGPGEVVVGDRKLVGVSQRRSRTLAVFQSAALLRSDSRRLASLMALDAEDRERAARCLDSTSGVLGGARTPEEVEEAFLGQLAGPSEP